VLDEGNVLQALFGGVGVEGKDHRAGAGAKGSGELGIGDMLLAFDGDALHAEAGSDGKAPRALDGVAIDTVLPAPPNAIAHGGGDQDQSDDAPSAAATVEGGASRQAFRAAEARQLQSGEGARRHDDRPREQRVGRSSCFASSLDRAYRLHDASSRIQRTSSPNERPL